MLNNSTLTISEVAQILRIGRSSAYKLAKEQIGFPVIKIGKKGQLRVPVAQFEEWVSSQKTV